MNTLQTTLSALQAQLASQLEDLQNYTDGVYDKNIAALEVEIANFISNKIGEELDKEYEGDSIKFSSSGITVTPKLSKSRYTNEINLYYRSAYSDDTTQDKIELSWYGSSCEADDAERLDYLATLGKIANIFPEIQKEYIGKWQTKYKQYRAAQRAFSIEVDKTREAIRQIEKQIEVNELESYKKVGFKCTIANSNRCVRDYQVQRGDVGDYCILSSNDGIKMYYSYSKYDYAYVYAFEILSKGSRNKMTIKVLINNDETNPLYREYSLTEKFFNEFIKEVFDWQTKSSVKQLEIANNEFERNATKLELTTK